ESAAKPATSRVLDYTSRPHCTSSGLVRFSVAPGDRIESDEPVARVLSAFGSVEETLRADCAGFVLGVADHARAVPGSEVIAIAEFGADSKAIKESGAQRAAGTASTSTSNP
ncbi:MAG: hypothetical protein ACWGPN_08925, partial [Gammaproteobacteria bacterium]